MQWQQLVLILLFIPSISTATLLNVPFENIIQSPNATIQSTYNFGLFSQIFCYENNQNINGIVYWPYQGVTQIGTLPIVLSINPDFEGQFADAVGTITIINNTSNEFVTSCLYGY